ncbi:unnamed protein product [Coregonus sp. 'balchen']|nr:unnamed protein product [Coregonus sp. 'balchen']
MADNQAENGLNKPPILRHYGDIKLGGEGGEGRGGGGGGGGGGAGGMAWRSLWNGMPQIPEMNKDQEPPQQKLPYRINDGSSFI